MTFEQAIALIADRPLFSAGDLPESPSRPVQLCRWVASGRLYRLRRGLYALKPPYQRSAPHPFLVANRLVDDSYVSLQSALHYHGMLGEPPPAITSVTTSRPGLRETELGTFTYRHIKTDLFFDYEEIEVRAGQVARVASAEKSFVDLIYLTPQSGHPRYILSLNLINLENLNLRKIIRFGKKMKQGRVKMAVRGNASLYRAEVGKKIIEEFKTRTTRSGE